ncbi:MAG: 16S rRNA (guanine(527)-N(7))-methyltransferase RsmG [Bacteroidales bacterium]|nr:16S rRNA (guanine(527)-N(7))-methyltransferase RsmG [Bacteroidales bacterium]
MEIIWKYFPELSPIQRSQLSQLPDIYTYWNEKINVISRKDISNIIEHHILHSMSVAKICTFTSNQKVIDIGTGGGFPGIPLAILFPNTHFTLVDSVGKKIKVVKEISTTLGLKNIEAIHGRVENLPTYYHTAVSRAVTNISTLTSWIKEKLTPVSPKISPSLIVFKGDNVKEELSNIQYPYKIHSLSEIFDEEFFKSKVLVEITFL